MKQTLAFYRAAGRTSSLVESLAVSREQKAPEKTEFVKKYHPMLQTPNRVQHYRAEMLPYLADDHKFAIRMATEWARSKPKATYQNKVEEEILRFLQERIGSNYFDHKKGLNLNMTVHEAELMIECVPTLKEAADRGEMHEIHS